MVVSSHCVSVSLCCDVGSVLWLGVVVLRWCVVIMCGGVVVLCSWLCSLLCL